MTTTVSVIIPHFALTPAWLARAVKSILDQTLPDLELMVVDDASPGQAWLDALQPFANDRRLQVWQANKNVGHYRLKNKLLSRMAGEFIAFQDADDWSHARRLERQVEYLRSRGADIVGTGFSYYSENEEPLRHKKMVKNVNWWSRLGKKFVLLHPTTMVKKQVFDVLQGFDGTARVAADDDFLLRALHRFKVRNVPENLYSYRLHSRALTQAKDTGHGSSMRQEYKEGFRARDRQRWLGGVRFISRATSESLAARANDVDFDLNRLW